MYGLPDLLWRAPFTLYTLARIFFSQSQGSFYALTPFELFLRGVYNKMARNFRDAGRFGYIWDEVLGSPQSVRYFQNWATYRLYGWLSPRMFALLSGAAYVMGILITGAAGGNIWQALFIALLLIPSPAFIYSLLSYQVKPEVIWWSCLVPLLVAAYSGHWDVAWIIGGALLQVNSAVSFISCGVLVAPWLSSLITGQLSFGLPFLWFVLGLIRMAFRFVSAHRSGFLVPSVTDHKRFIQVPSSFNLLETIFFVQGMLLPLVLSSWHVWPLPVLLAITLVALYAINQRIVKIADTVSVRLVFLGSMVAAALLSGHWLAILGVLAFAYYYPNPGITTTLLNGEKGERQLVLLGEKSTEEKIRFFEAAVRRYPNLLPMPLPKPEPLLRLLEHIPKKSRVLMEQDADARTDKERSYWTFHAWTYEFLPTWQIEFVNQTSLARHLDPLLDQRYLARFNASAMTVEEMHKVCQTLGVASVLAFTPHTTQRLAGAGFQPLVNVNFSDIAEFCDLMQLPRHDLTLFLVPGRPDVVSPSVQWKRNEKSISWDAEAGQEYIVRYRFHPQFIAEQDGARLTVVPSPVFDDVPLQFMSVRAEKTARLALTFKPKWF
jgi:hypothetical protein